MHDVGRSDVPDDWVARRWKPETNRIGAEAAFRPAVGCGVRCCVGGNHRDEVALGGHFGKERQHTGVPCVASANNRHALCAGLLDAEVRCETRNEITDCVSSVDQSR